MSVLRFLGRLLYQIVVLPFRLAMLCLKLLFLPIEVLVLFPLSVVWAGIKRLIIGKPAPPQLMMGGPPPLTTARLICAMMTVVSADRCCIC